MARINIENSLFKDARFLDLIIHCGCRFKALGLITSAWILAQEHWLKYRAIPKKAWAKELDILVKLELAEPLENGDIYVKGSKKAFSWLEQKSEAGRKGGRPSNQIKHQLEKADDKLVISGEKPPSPLSFSSLLSPIQTLTPTHNTYCSEPPQTATRSRHTFPIISENDFELIPKQSRDNWCKLYDVEYLQRESVKILNWLISNPNKNKRTAKGWIQFLSNWYERGWDQHLRKGINSSNRKETTDEYIERLSKKAKDKVNGL